MGALVSELGGGEWLAALLEASDPSLGESLPAAVRRKVPELLGGHSVWRVCVFQPQSLPSSRRDFLGTSQSTTRFFPRPNSASPAVLCAPVQVHTCHTASAQQNPCSTPLCPCQGLLTCTSVCSPESTRHPELTLINQQLVINMQPNCSSPLNAYHTPVPQAPLCWLW